MRHDTNAKAADPGGSSDAFKRAYPICRATGLSAYALAKCAAMGSIRYRTDHTGGMLYSESDARRVAQHGARA